VTVRKSERLMNLVICLLVARTYVSKAKIREVVEGYHDQSDDAFEKMFERDKDALKELGIPIELGHVDRAFEDEPGYRIKRGEFELPEIHLEADEAAVVGLAARVWQHATLAEATTSALAKLRAGGVTVDVDALTLVEPQVATIEPAFGPLWDAVVRRIPVSFTYRPPGREPARRHFEPWGIVSWHGHWYTVGHDRDRDAVRMFRLSRVEGDVTRAGRAGSYAVPEGTDVRKLAGQLGPADPTQTATVRVRQGAGFALRRRSSAVRPAPDGWDVLELPFHTADALADEVLPLGVDAMVLEPADARAVVIRRLEALVSGGRR
jgi:proteasome accessory factor B